MRLPLIAALAASLLLGACGTSLHPSTETTAMTETPSPSVTRPDTTTYCLGRFLIDMPAGSTLSGGSYKYDFAQIEPPVAMTLEQFNQELNAREEKLRSTKHKKEPSLLRMSQQPALNTRVLAFFEKPYITAGINIEGYKWVDGVRFLVKVQVDDDKQEFGLKRMSGILSRLRPRADSDIPTDPGYCFEGGFIANEEWENEVANVDIDIAGHPDAFVTVWFYPLAAHKHDKPLLERMGGVLQQLGTFASGVHALRKGERQVGEFKGQEYLATVPNSGGMRGHLFKWETQGEGTLQDPHMTIELSTGAADSKGNPQKTRLSNEQALKLWDSILNSFRLRPVGGAPANTSEATPPITPLGELAATGRHCPHTGWWQCYEEPRPVQGGRRQFFRAGDVMPHVVLLGEQSLWQKIKGEQPTHVRATVWTLVEYETVPVTPVAVAEAATPPTPPGEGVS